MRNHVVFKFLALMLCAACLLCALVSAAGLAVIVATDIGEGDTVEDLRRESEFSRHHYQAYRLTQRVLAQELGGCDEELAETLYETNFRWNAWTEGEDYSFQIRDASGNVLYASAQTASPAMNIEYTGYNTFEKLVYGPVKVADGLSAQEAMKKALDAVPTEAAPTEEEPWESYEAQERDEESDTASGAAHVTQNVEEAAAQNDAVSYKTVYYTDKNGQEMLAAVEQVDAENVYSLTLQIANIHLQNEETWDLLTTILRNQERFTMALGVSLLLFAILAVYLCTAAGKTPGSEEIRPHGLNCLSLDVYAAGVACLAIVYLLVVTEWLETFLEKRMQIALVYGGYICCLAFVGFCFACAAQFKTKGRYWWHHSLVGWCTSICWKLLCLFWKGILWLFHNSTAIFRWCWRQISTLWNWGWMIFGKLWHGIWDVLGCIWHFFAGKTAQLYALLPLVWQWLLVGSILGVWILVAALSRSEVMLLTGVAAGICAILYGASVFGTLLQAAQRMRAGDLEIKVDEKIMLGAFRDFARELNGLSDVVVLVSQKQMRSERMRTELITNVTHDIKTPLTSIINYVDLLQKPHQQEDTKVYLEVLSRQSNRLKRLIDDLLELSKASTGNISVELQTMDAVEAVNQALGEFTDKLAAAQLTPMFRQPQDPMLIRADGKLTWRAMSNLLSNASKYAQPGTRLYIDMIPLEDKLCVSFKNISRDPLNVSAEELMERFVRGEASRNQEGSGLGLNIAQSMMELQHGTLELLVDGDLFKVTLIFPREQGN